jgi:hypothetical protein
MTDVLFAAVSDATARPHHPAVSVTSACDRVSNAMSAIGPKQAFVFCIAHVRFEG